LSGSLDLKTDAHETWAGGILSDAEALGDFNGDGADDFVVADVLDDTWRGSVFLVAATTW
jgi:hypothetical protein